MDEYMGTIVMFAGNFAPSNWMFCAGQLLSVSQYSALFSLLGTTYGGDGRTNFALPDLRSRVPVGGGMGNSPSLGITTNLGQQGGSIAVTLNQSQIPAHTHSLMVNTGQSTANVPSNNQTIAAPNTPSGRTSTPTNGFITSPANTPLDPSSISIYGGSQPHDNMQPYLGVSYIICVNGVYPPHP